MKNYFESKKEAMQVAQERNTQCFKMKFGKHKGMYFVGSHMEYININY